MGDKNALKQPVSGKTNQYITSQPNLDTSWVYISDTCDYQEKI